MSIATAYADARWQVICEPTRALRRTERTYRRLAAEGVRLGRRRLACWVAVRGELRRRGKRVPEANQPPKWWGR